MKLPEEKDLNPVYLEDLCQKLNESKEYLLLDVRSLGEFRDTSQFSYLNLGRFNNALNIDLNELSNRLGEIESYKDKDVFVYCSHSNRSRGACGILIDAGFKHVYNVNGGISEYVFDNINCPEGFYSNLLPYKLFSPEKTKELISGGDIVLIDIRTPEEFNGTSADEFKNIGKLKGAVNIPYSELESRINELPKDKKIILYDFDNSISQNAAAIFLSKGYSDVGIMIYGLYSWVYKFGSGDAALENTPSYKILDYRASLDVIKNHKDVILLDVRSEDDFNNKNKMEHFNLGHLKGSINIPADDIQKRIKELSGYKDKEILVYGNLKESKAPDVCKYLQNNGFKNVNNAASGYYKFIWNRKNIKNYDLPQEMIVNP
ncbi:MAG: rhodanese-like domain-containing protein [Ignavibacteria bacterium]